MFAISEKEILERLIFDNPWWENSAGIDARYRGYPRRFYFAPFLNLVQDRSINRAVILMGPRRVGKTVMVYHSIQALIESGVSGSNIFYASLETPLYTGVPLEKLLGMFVRHKSLKKDSPIYVFFDEVQYLREWEVHLKSLVDSFPSYKFVATGSAAAALKLKSQESGAGRFTDFVLPPLTFAEYIHFIGKTDELIDKNSRDDGSRYYRANDINELNREFFNYLNYGGYPEAVMSQTIQQDIGRYIKGDIVDKVLLRDLPSLYGVSDIQELNRLFTTLAYNTGNEITLEGLSKSAGVAKNTIKRYLEYLEAAFLIRRVNRIDQNAKHFKRITAFKVYLTNPSMRSALFGHVDIESESMGNLTETAIYSQWLHSSVIDKLYYARWNTGEVDIVCLDSAKQKPVWIIEVKWSDRPDTAKSLLDHCVTFTEKNSLYDHSALCTTKTIANQFNYRGVDFNLVPSSCYAYTLGSNILKNKF